jgi:hypothetical protein
MFRLILVISIMVAGPDWILPTRQMPIDYYSMFRTSFPLALIWIVLLGFALYRFRLKALWLLLAAPLALYWPMWIVVHGLPSCYYVENCH